MTLTPHFPRILPTGVNFGDLNPTTKVVGGYIGRPCPSVTRRLPNAAQSVNVKIVPAARDQYDKILPGYKIRFKFDPQKRPLQKLTSSSRTPTAR